jgi:hypothetical protein
MVYKFHFPTTSKASRQRLKELTGSLVSVAGLVGKQVQNQEGQELGKVVDLVCRWDSDETYPPLTGIIIKVGGRRVWIPIDNIDHIGRDQVWLGSARLDLRDFKPRKGEVRLYREVSDHQLIDVDGARVVRASDLYIAEVSGKNRLVGIDVGLKPLLRRLVPSKLNLAATPDSVIDWATIQSFGGQGGKKELKLSANRQELRRMRPGELADMLEDLGRVERRELLSALTPELAADALEEMEPNEVEAILRESSPYEAAKYLARMEPDEAADALRDVDRKLRDELLNALPSENAQKVKSVLMYDETTAGGIMTTTLLTSPSSATVGEIKKRLKSSGSDPYNLKAIVIVSTKGKLLYDLPMVELLLAKEKQTLKELMKPPATITVLPQAPLREVAERLIESRAISIVVADEKERPLGRIIADDLLDVILPSGRFHFPRLLS